MKKLLLALLSALALFAVTSCEMTYGEGKYPELEQWFAPHMGDDNEWIAPGPKCLMTSVGGGVYEIEVTTGIKNVGITLCTNDSYANQKFWDDATDDTQANFGWKDDFGHKQLVLKKPGTYMVSVDSVAKTWSVKAK